MKKLSFILGIVAGAIIILTGILTALKITPSIVLQGLEVGLGFWRIFAGSIILFLVFFVSREKDFAKTTNIIILFMGVFEVFVFYFEKDYSILIIGPFIAILAGILGIMKR